MRSSLFIFFSLLSVLAIAQETVVKGKVTDASSGDPIPFVNVLFKGTNIGVTTDFDGNYLLKSLSPTDTLLVSYVGYKPKKKKITKGVTQVQNFQLEEDITSLQEIVVNAGENPAYEILRRVVRNKNKNDKRKLTAYEYDTYTKIEAAVDNMTEKFREKKLIKKISQVLDSVDRIAGEDGKPILPIFISESVSKLYFRDNPQLKYENILKSKIHGLGVEDGTMVTQFVGSSFQEYNFYQNWLNIVSKDFVSPIADGWKLYYEYDLTDSLYVGDHYCYRLDFFPKSPQDLAFTGTVWITKKDYAIKQIDATVGKQANLNFIEKIKIQQELEPTVEGAWLPVKNRVLIDVGELTNTSAGMLAKFYTSNKNFVVNKPYEPSFYAKPIVMEEDARMFEEEEYWDTLRHEPLSETEKSVYKMIDTLVNIPVVRTYTEIINILVNGYFDAGKLYLGPYVSMVGVNTLEGFRIQGGFKTSIDFSKKWVLGGQLGYGFKDDRIKYSAFVQRILSKEKWTTVTFRTRSDISRVGLDDESLSDNLLILAAQRWGNFRKGYYFKESKVSFQREMFRGFSQRVAFRYSTFRPAFDFYYLQEQNEPTSVASTYETAELILESRYAKDEIFIQNDNERFSMGTSKWPIITLRYTQGIKGVIDSDFDYSKLRLTVNKEIRMGMLGSGYATLTGEKVFGVLPYPLLNPHIGNQTPFYTSVTYNLMNYSEFVSDQYASLQYQQHFEGFLLNRIPLMRRLKWRLVGTANVILGDMSQQNRDNIVNDQGTPVESISFLNNEPYVELGYGVENILKFIRIDFIHRMPRSDDAALLPDGTQKSIRKFGVFFSMQFDL